MQPLGEQPSSTKIGLIRLTAATKYYAIALNLSIERNYEWNGKVG